MLSTKHGILTPYTSFLADETTDRMNLSANRRGVKNCLSSWP